MRFFVFIFIFSFFPFVVFANPDTTKDNLNANKNKELQNKLTEKLNKLTEKLNKKTCIGSSVEVTYCEDNRKLYKPRISFNTGKDHKFRYNPIKKRFRYLFKENHALEFNDREDTYMYKYTIPWDF